MYNRNYNVLPQLSARSIENMIFSVDKLCRIAEAKNDRSQIVHYHVQIEELRNELRRKSAK